MGKIYNLLSTRCCNGNMVYLTSWKEPVHQVKCKKGKENKYLLKYLELARKEWNSQRIKRGARIQVNEGGWSNDDWSGHSSLQGSAQGSPCRERLSSEELHYRPSQKMETVEGFSVWGRDEVQSPGSDEILGGGKWPSLGICNHRQQDSQEISRRLEGLDPVS
jgi:hypothetical protein